MEVKGIITAARLVKGVANLVIDPLEAGASIKRKKRSLKYPLSGSMTEQDIFEYVGKGMVKITIFGDMIYNIWPD